MLIVDDEASIRDTLADLFEEGGTRVVVAATVEEAKAALARERLDLIVTDIRLGAKRDGGLQVMAVAGMLAPDAVVVALTAFPDEAVRRAAERLGASCYLTKPADLKELVALSARCGITTTLGPVGGPGGAAGSGGERAEGVTPRVSR